TVPFSTGAGGSHSLMLGSDFVRRLPRFLCRLRRRGKADRARRTFLKDLEKARSALARSASRRIRINLLLVLARFACRLPMA
ncbi:hypothetical protein PENTCL1PPCAC_23920, partial [Pristionchus entomophagus]